MKLQSNGNNGLSLFGIEHIAAKNKAFEIDSVRDEHEITSSNVGGGIGCSIDRCRATAPSSEPNRHCFEYQKLDKESRSTSFHSNVVSGFALHAVAMRDIGK